MTKTIKTIQSYMTRSPHSIGKGQTLAQAHRLMRQHRIRHLPVLDGGHLVGMLTQRDLALVETLKDVDPESVEVEDAMSSEVYMISPSTPLHEVVAEMAEKKYGSAVVMHDRKVVGIFTTVDACVALRDLLRDELGGGT